MHHQKHSEETKKKISQAKKGVVSNRKGVVLSMETREKISASKKGRKIHSDEQRKKWSLERTGERNPFYKHGLSRNSAYWRRIRSVREQKADGFHSNGEWENLKIQYGFRCPCCFRKEPEISLTRDHVIPLSKGGTHKIENIQPLCQSCNSKKKTKIIKFNYQ